MTIYENIMPYWNQQSCPYVSSSPPLHSSPREYWLSLQTDHRSCSAKIPTHQLKRYFSTSFISGDKTIYFYITPCKWW